MRRCRFAVKKVYFTNEAERQNGRISRPVYSEYFAKVLKMEHFRSFKVCLSRQDLSTKHRMSHVRQLLSFVPNGGGVAYLLGAGGPNVEA